MITQSLATRGSLKMGRREPIAVSLATNGNPKIGHRQNEKRLGALKMYSEKQTKQLHIRVSNANYEKIKKSAELYGLSLGQYAKQIVQKSRLKQPKFDHTAAKKIETELNHIGNNLNQLTRALNQLAKDSVPESSHPIEKTFTETTEAVMALQKEVEHIWQQLS